MRLSLAWRELKRYEKTKSDKQITELDLSHNEFRDMNFLLDLPALEILVMDSNKLTATSPIPHHKNLRVLSVNDNLIESLPNFVGSVGSALPSLTHLSMLKNGACPNFFNGGTPRTYQDYRHYVLSKIPRLVTLDSTEVTEEERIEAKRVYGSMTSVATSAATSRSDMMRREARKAHAKKQAEKKKREEEEEARKLREKEDDWTSDEEDDGDNGF